MTDEMLERNRRWALQKKRENPDFFSHLSKGQSPSIFWIGCCDSRLIPTEIFNLSLGDVFVQTNIANQVRTDDRAMMGALFYAVEALKVERIVVCGHTHCGGIEAALNPKAAAPSSVVDWVAPIANRYRGRASPGQAVELNVQDQTGTLKGLLRGCSRVPDICGQVFDMEEGLIRVLE